MEAINLPDIKLVKEEGNIAMFVMEPFYPGYGTTVGNALRRVLLTSLPGAAVSAFKLAGIDHEFTTIDGVKEDIVEIMLSLKGLRFILHEEGPVMVTLKKTKVGEVTGKDIVMPSSVELVNPDHHIATITSDINLDMELRIERGRGYVPSEAIDDREFAIGMVAVDAIFSPIKRCSFAVENTRVGERVDYDKVTLDIETDGTITCKDALKIAADILLEQFNIFRIEIKLPTLPTEAVEETAEITGDETGDNESGKVNPMDFSVEEINLSVRTTNALVQNNVKTIRDIVNIGRESLFEMKGLGERALTEIADKLDELGVEFI
ncbi:TPA: DNA-directed RNA polymerase subunit alpha [Patescibacteria group bacterium]|uniref:DNA-directed RNA polymerase subunit alpha n=2 Tax=Bacteria division Kazan-3B-28 TaxID=1798534 RepID=A0A0G1KU89_UNCK3|nr:MAG: DNA-directed RNA polymerase subunit alpha [candidate division Kazan bacterium GW2011_GWA1_44_22]KKT87128.1 MAG: DNA-directed RNA polymerase subunit alpha [candidate division Kazan bacterium GW2011_GWB1_45_10]HAR54940.1 DNA-directed RNA polymerase subunit alpha [Patescibacteria group bacterium]HCR41895.1 DNA-directed RNA polymerase subunit alpha [Patescibacteria group bacterium]